MTPSVKKFGVLLIKAVIASLSVWFIFWKINSRDDFDLLVDTVSTSMQNPEKSKVFVIICVLMILNWFIETAKWKLLLKYISPAGWLVCFRSVMSGVTVSILTPNRIGEFAGRVLHLDKGIRVKAAIASIIGSMNQLLITVLAGGIGLIFSMGLFVTDAKMVRIFIILVLIGMGVVSYIYFRIPALTKLIQKISALRKITLYTAIFEKYTIWTLIKLSLLSAFRYLVFSLQFILMLHWFDINIPWQDAMNAISIMYLALAIVPSIALSELTIRGSVALYFFSAYSGNSSGILAATSMIWLINLVVPAVIGALAAFYFRLTR